MLKPIVNLKKLVGALATAAVVFLAAAPAEAATTWLRLVPECATAKGLPGAPPPVPSLVCVLQTFGNIAQIILGLTGSLALIMFVYGGFLMVSSGGSQEAVSKGKTTLRNAIVGILIIMCSGLLIQYGLKQIGLSSDYHYVGEPCSQNANGSNSGQYVQIPDGSLLCVESGMCNQKLSRYGFDCEDVTTAGQGKYCLANLCAGSSNMMCCYDAARAAPSNP